MNQYDVGDLVRISVKFRDLNGALADPTTVTGWYKDPSGNKTTPSVTQDATGSYHMDIDVDESGVWHYGFKGTGAVVAAGEDSFEAKATRF